MDFYKRAQELRGETVTHRRWLHSHAEVGLNMPKAQAYVMEQLKNYGLEPRPCGHDFHAAMLLTAAKLLKENEAALSGRIRFMFQTAEDTFEGAKDMIANGILEGVDGALAYHVGSGRTPTAPIPTIPLIPSTSASTFTSPWKR